MFLVALLVYVCARNLLRSHKSGGCGGNCASCGSCACGRHGDRGGDRGDRGQTPVSLTSVSSAPSGTLAKQHVSERKIHDMQTYFNSQLKK